MAVIESKRSSRRTQPAKPNTSKRRKTTSRRSRRNATRRSYRSSPFSRSIRFKDVKGKAVDFVEVYTSGGYHCIDVRFQDKTALTFEIDPGFRVQAGYFSWKTGNQSPIKEWPLIWSAI
jgi:hypothetical protein